MPHKLYAELRERGPMLPTAAEEVLRWSTPVICFARTVTRDIELGGQQMRAGDRFDLIEITDEPKWMSAGPAAAVGVAVQSLPVRLG
jgi:hypothetical protein